MIARFYSLVLRVPDGSGRKTHAAELVASGVPYKNIRGRRYYQLISSDADVYTVPEGWGIGELMAWAPKKYDAMYFDGHFTALMPPRGRRARTRYNETYRCLTQYLRGNGEAWIYPLP